MRIDLTKTVHILFFVGFLPTISLAIGWVFLEYIPAIPFWVDVLSPLAAYGLLYLFFEHVAWRWPVFATLDIASAPNLNGRWAGQEESERHIKNGDKIAGVVLEVRQTFSKVTAQTYKREYTDHCDGRFMHLNGKRYLVLLSEAEPGSSHTGKNETHNGVAKLSYFKDENRLVGTYFDSNGDFGEITLDYKSSKLHHQFE